MYIVYYAFKSLYPAFPYLRFATVTLFFTGKVNGVRENSTEYSEITVSVRFNRRYEFYLLSLYIPTTLLVIIAYCTLFYNPADFNSRIVVALTDLLVLTSLYTQVSKKYSDKNTENKIEFLGIKEYSRR